MYWTFGLHSLFTFWTDYEINPETQSVHKRTPKKKTNIKSNLSNKWNYKAVSKGLYQKVLIEDKLKVYSLRKTIASLPPQSRISKKTPSFHFVFGTIKLNLTFFTYILLIREESSKEASKY